MARPEKIRLGDLLIQQALITPEQLQFALDEQTRNGRKLGRVLVDNHFISEEQISETLARQLNIPYVNLKIHSLNLELVRRLPESQARRFRALPLEERKSSVLVGMADPTDLSAFDELGRAFKRNIDVAVVTEGQLLETIDRVYRRSEEISGLARELTDKPGAADVDFGELLGTVGVEETPVVNLLQALFGDAMQLHASGIHLELHEGRLQIRFRIDGRLQLQAELDSKLAAALMVRLKLMSGLDASEKRLPQEGRFNVRVRNQAVDVRISVLPAQHGESVVMWILNRDGGLLASDKLGMPPQVLERFRALVQRGSGLVLVTGPVGSGKSATLGAALMEARADDRKIIAVESAVEYALPGIIQVQVDEKIGLTFARALGFALHQEPDILLVGELHDPETAQAALRAAMAGCMVFSALHLDNATSALSCLVDMGVPQYVVASSLQAVLAQRLLRRICANCAEPHTPTVQEQAWLAHAGVTPAQQGKLQHGRGCSSCKGSGYSGRIVVYEMLEVDRLLAEAVAHGDATQRASVAQAQLQGHSLLDHALAQMVDGLTTVSEAMRIGNHADK